MSLESRKQVMIELLEEKKQLEQQLFETEDAIKGLRKICRHKHADGTSALNFKGSDSHHHYYVCDICQIKIEE